MGDFLWDLVIAYVMIHIMGINGIYDWTYCFFRAIGMVCENGSEINLEKQVPYP